MFLKNNVFLLLELPVTGHEIHVAIRQENVLRLRELLEKE